MKNRIYLYNKNKELLHKSCYIVHVRIIMLINMLSTFEPARDQPYTFSTSCINDDFAIKNLETRLLNFTPTFVLQLFVLFYFILVY